MPQERIHYLQVELELFDLAEDLAVVLDLDDEDKALGMLLRLIRLAAKETGPKDGPPDGIVEGPRAIALVEKKVRWTGERGAFIEAVSSQLRRSLVEVLPNGLRIRGADRYRNLWEGAEARSEKARNAATVRWERERHAQSMLQECSEHAPSIAQTMLGDAKIEIEKKIETKSKLASARAGVRDDGDGEDEGEVLALRPPPLVDGAAALLSAWNDIAEAPLAPVRSLTPKLRKKCSQAYEHRAMDGPDGWRAIFQRVNASRFLGGGGKSGFVASFDWALREENAQEVLRGVYFEPSDDLTQRHFGERCCRNDCHREPRHAFPGQSAGLCEHHGSEFEAWWAEERAGPLSASNPTDVLRWCQLWQGESHAEKIAH